MKWRFWSTWKVFGSLLLFMGKDMSLAATASRESLVASTNGATIWFFTGVRSHVLLQSTFLIPSFATAFEFTDERFLSCVDPGVDQQMSWSKEGLSTSWFCTDVGFASLMMATAVVDEVSLGSEGTNTSKWTRKGFVHSHEISSHAFFQVIRILGRTWNFRKHCLLELKGHRSSGC